MRPMGGSFHVTCHGCRFEGVYDDHAEATADRQRHELDSDHPVSLLEIDRPDPAETDD